MHNSIWMNSLPAEFLLRSNYIFILSIIWQNRCDASQWRHNGHDSVLNHQPHHCLLNLLFGRRWKKASKLRGTGLWVGNSPGTGEFPAQMASNAENVSIWWRHHCSWNPLVTTTTTRFSCIVNTGTVDLLATLGASSTTAMVLTSYLGRILFQPQKS